MESRWTPSGPNEVGIDGYIELFDPATRKPLGLTPFVFRRFDAERDRASNISTCPTQHYEHAGSNFA